MKELQFRKIIETIIDEINEAKKSSQTIHSAGNIKASGDEVENLIREKISLFLPERYLVKQGHIVNSEGKVSNQFDIIIFDRLNTPKFFESKNSTVFYPIESVLAVGEIKKTLRKNDIVEFSEKIKFLKTDMKRQLIKNSIYNGDISDDASFFDIVHMGMDKKYKNPLFSFIFSIDVEDFSKLLFTSDNKYMPNDICILNYGYMVFGEFNNKALTTKIEDEFPIMDLWVEIRKPGVNSIAMLFNQLINHLNNCYIQPFSISNYMTDKEFSVVKGSDISIYKMKSESE